ncbi:hypothetical protein [Allochromatium tepidum]|uniref:hypothetical protein n=1 Tax=Allochromatium tepidum TaxID=553982 RepID=UPI001BD0573E|nr:hypothetical protein [Allochromatium tepidum]
MSLLMAPVMGFGWSSPIWSSEFPEVSVAPETLPEWVRDSRRLSQMLGGQSVGDVSDAQVIQRLSTPIEGLDALVIEATISKKDQESQRETFVLYVDTTGRYLMAGLFIDMEQNRNLGQVIERQVRGERADSPAQALRPLEMHGLDAEPIEDPDGSLIVVVDLGPEIGRRNFLRIAALRQSLREEGRAVRALRVIPVSAAHDELSTGAMAMALGYDTLNPGDGYQKLLEYAEKSHAAPWLDKDRLRDDPLLKQAMGLGIFRLDDNSTQALLARLNTLPLVYEVRGNRADSLPVPTDGDEWKKLLLLP